jgi:hypothetical protein
MRTRNKVTNTTVLFFPATSYTEFGNSCSGVGGTFGGTTSHTDVTYIPSYSKETMHDGLGKDVPHTCHHRKYTQHCEVPSGSSRWAYMSGHGPSIVVDNDNGRTNAVRSQSMYSAFEPWVVGTNGASDYPPYWNVTMPSFDETVVKNNLLQNARQLKADVMLNIIEAGQIVPSIRSLTNSLPNMARNWRQLRKVIKTASGSYLAWKFGVSPILQDIMAINRFLPRMKDSLKRHESSSHSRFSYTAPIQAYMTPSPYASGYNHMNGYPTYKWNWNGVSHREAEVRFVLVVKPTSSRSSGLVKDIDFALSRFSSSPASLAWELVPFSFVVDWFVDLRSLLSKADSFIGFNPYEIVSFTKSVSYEFETQTQLTGHSPCDGSTILSVESSHRYKHYERSLVGASPLVVSNPRFGKSQAAVSAALISQALSSIGANQVRRGIRSFNIASSDVIGALLRL